MSCKQKQDTLTLIVSYGGFVMRAVSDGVLNIEVDSPTGLYAKSCAVVKNFKPLSDDEQKRLSEEANIDYKCALCLFYVSEHVKAAGDDILRQRFIQEFKEYCERVGQG